MKQLTVLLLLFFIFTQSVSAQTFFSVDLQKNSSLTINGSTNLLSFKLFQNGEKLSRRNLTISTSRNQNKVFLSQNQLSLAVKNFSSDNRIALNEFLKLLKSDTYPTLQVQLNYLDMQTSTEKVVSTNGNAFVNITITGVTKQFSIPISTIHEGDLYTVDGEKKMSIREFGLVPPVKMMGLVKVSEWITVNFHMICKIRNQDTASK
ncbi:MAG: hypothetical protein HXX14_21565 [Bacteroidetes bacterium]|nr:hypothetical protein [Bacteroidota bacterium]